MGAWGPGKPGLLATCYDENNSTFLSNIIDPTKDDNLNFIGLFFDVILCVFGGVIPIGTRPKMELRFKMISGPKRHPTDIGPGFGSGDILGGCHFGMEPF